MGDRPEVRWRLRELLLTAGAVLGCVCLVAALASLLFGVRPLIFRSGSMSPAIETGALGVARTVDATQLRVGDIVSVTDGRGTRVTHRVVQITPNTMTATLVLKGDANRIVDAETYEVRQVDRVWFAVPALGYVVGALSSPWAIFLGGALVGVLVMVAFGPTGSAGRRGPPPSAPDLDETVTRPEPRRAVGSGRSERATMWARRGVITTVVGAVAASGIAYDAEAAWADSATAQTGTFATAVRVAAPVLSCGLLGLGSVQVTWTAVTGVTDYEVTIAGTNPTTRIVTPPTRSTTITGANNGTVTVRARVAYPNTTWTSNPSNVATYSITLGLLGVCTT